MLGQPVDLQRAIDLAAASGGGTIVLPGGIHFLSAPLSIPPVTGTIRIVAADGEAPVLSGGTPVTSWIETIVGGKRVWKANISDGRFTQLWVNGTPRQRARHPNVGYLQTSGSPERSGAVWDGQRSFRFQHGSIPSIANPVGAVAVIMSKWIASRVRIDRIDYTSGVLSTLDPSELAIESRDLFYIENAPELLDAFGEWWLDAQTKTLYYIPLPSETTQHTVAVYPRLTTLIRVQDVHRSQPNAHSLEIVGIGFEHTDWIRPMERESGQAAVEVSAAIEMRNAHGVIIRDVKLKNLGGAGINIAAGCRDIEISRIQLEDFGASGVLIGPRLAPANESLETRNVTLTNSLIRNGGNIFHGGVGVWIGHSSHNRITNNLIQDMYYTGISVGWRWDFQPSYANSNTIARNDVRFIGRKSNGDGPILSDMGGVYTLGNQPGTLVEGNFIRDISAYKYAGSGIYLDEGSSEISVVGNRVLRSSHHSLMIHRGRNLQVSGNQFLYAAGSQIDSGSNNSGVTMMFSNNIVAWSSGEAFQPTRSHRQIIALNNLYWRSTRPWSLRLFGMEPRLWFAMTRDRGSRVANPHFVSSATGELALDAHSPAYSMGLTEFRLDLVGPQD